MTSKQTPSRTDRRFARREDGGMTSYGLFLIVASLGFGGLAVDMASAVRAESQLQAAADSAAHAALVIREWGTLDEARAKAVEVARENMPPGAFGQVLRTTDVNFGTWDRGTETFTIDNNEWETVLIHVERYQSHGNAVRTFFLNVFGLDSWDVRRGSVFEAYVPKCMTEGFMAQDDIDLQGNNTFQDGFCIHANDTISLNNHNSFEPGVTVSVPGGKSVTHGGFGSNPGLQEALTTREYDIRILGRLDDIFANLESMDPRRTPEYITSGPVALNKNKIKASDVTPGTLYTKTCAGGKLTLEAGEVFDDIVIVTDCDVSFGQGVKLRNVVVATRHTGTITGSQNMEIGRDDNCAPGGGAQILTYGSFHAPAAISLYGGQIIALNDVNIAAKPNGIGGASIIAGDDIDVNTHVTMGYCGSGMEQNFDVKWFRLAG